jgi:hypothetical protein
LKILPGTLPLRLADYSKGFDSVSYNQYQKEIHIANKVEGI